MFIIVNLLKFFYELTSFHSKNVSTTNDFGIAGSLVIYKIRIV